jgi:Flp pilus assembly protein TadD
MLGEKSRPQQFDAYVLEARQALAARNYRGAAEAARAASAADPRRSEARFVEAQAREAMGDLAGALPLWESLVEERHGDLAALVSYASLAVQRGRGEEALVRLREKIREAPDDPDLQGVAGWVALRLGRTNEAKEHLEATWGTAAADRYAVHLGRARLLEGDLAGAAQAAELAVEEEPNASAWVLLGDAQRAMGLAAGAESAYLRALDHDPGSYAARVNLGVLKLAQGDASSAAELFTAAAQGRPDAPDAWNDLGLALRAQGDLEGARSAYEKALAVSPEFAPALKNLGILSEKYLEQPGAAVAFYDRYLAARPADEEVDRWRKIAERTARSEH